MGLTYTRSRLDFVYYFPTEESWDFLDDRGITSSSSTRSVARSAARSRAAGADRG